MYAWLWRKLPGPTPVKAVEALVLAMVVVLLLFTFVFPWLEPRLPFNEVTVDETLTSGATVPSPSSSVSFAPSASSS